MPIENNNNINPNTGLPYTKRELDYLSTYNNIMKNRENRSPLDKTSNFEGISQIISNRDAESFEDYNINPVVGGAQEEVRAERQSGLSQLGAGLGKMGTTALTTFADGTVGTVAGILQFLGKGIGRYAEGDSDGFELSDFVQNDFSTTMQEYNAKMEEIIPNYRTEEEIAAPWYKNMVSGSGAANFWGDVVLKNFGFTIGALGAGALTGSLAAEALGTRAIAARILDPKYKDFLIKKLGKEAAEELVSNPTKAVQMLEAAGLESSSLGTQLLKDAGTLRKLNAAQTTLASTIAASSEARIEGIHSYQEYKEKRIKELVAEGADPEFAEIQADKEALTVGNITFGLNLPILLASNYVQFKSLLSGNFTDQAKKIGALSVDFGEGAVATPMSRLEKYRRLASNPFIEANEEMSQAWVSEGASNYVSRRNDINSKGVMVDAISSTIDGFKNTYGNIDRWEEGFVGALVGGLGMVNFNKLSSKEAFKSDDPWMTGGIFESYREIKELDANAAKYADALNTIIKDGKILKLMNNVVVNNSYETDKEAAASEGDKRLFKTLENEQLTHDLATVIDAGVYEQYLQELNKLTSLSGEEIRSMMMVKTPSNTLIDPNSDKTNDELKAEVNKKYEKVKQKAKEIKDIKAAIEVKLGNKNVDDKFKYELTRLISNTNDRKDRVAQLTEELEAFYTPKEQKFKEGEPAPDPKNFQNELKTLVDLIKKGDFDGVNDKFSELANELVDLQKKKIKLPKDGNVSDFLDSIKNLELDKQDIVEKLNDLIGLEAENVKTINLYTQMFTDPAKYQEKLDAQVEAQIEEEAKEEKKKEPTAKELGDLLNQELIDKGYKANKEGRVIFNEQQIDIDGKKIKGAIVKKGSKFYTLNRDRNNDFIFTDFFDRTKFEKFTLETFAKLLKDNKLEVINKDEFTVYARIETLKKAKTAQLAAIGRFINSQSFKLDENEKSIKTIQTKIEQIQSELNKLIEDAKKNTYKGKVFRFNKSFRSFLNDTINKYQDAIEYYQELIEGLSKDNVKIEQMREAAEVYFKELETLNDTNFSFIRQTNNRVNQIISNYIDEGLLQDLNPDYIREVINRTNEQINSLMSDIELMSEVQDTLNSIKEDSDFIKEFYKEYKKDFPFFTNVKGQPLVFNTYLINRFKNRLQSSGKVNLLSSLESKNISELIKTMNAFQALVSNKPDNIIDSILEDELIAIQETIDDLKNKVSENQEITKNLERYLLFNQYYNAFFQTAAGLYKKFNKIDKPKDVERADGQVEITEVDNPKEFYSNALKPTIFATVGLDVLKDATEETSEVFNDNAPTKRWYTFLDSITYDDITNNGYYGKLFVHNPDSADAFNLEFNELIPPEARTKGDDIIFVLFDKTGLPVKKDGKLLFTNIGKAETWFPKDKEPRLNVHALVSKHFGLDIKNNPNLDKEFVAKHIAEAIEKEKIEYNKFRADIKEAVAKGETPTVTVLNVSNGIPITRKESTSVKKIMNLKEGQWITKPDNTKEYVLDYQIKVSNGIPFEVAGKVYNPKPGNTFIIKKGQVIHVKPRFLSKSEINTIIAILQYALPLESDTPRMGVPLPDKMYFRTPLNKDYPIFPNIKAYKNGTDSLLSNFMFYGKANDNRPYQIWGTKVVNYTDKEGNVKMLTKDNLHDKNSDEFKAFVKFLESKIHNVNTGTLNSNSIYLKPYVDSNGKIEFKKYNSYSDYLVEGVLESNIKPKTEGSPRQFMSKYLVFQNKLENKKTSDPAQDIPDEIGDIDSEIELLGGTLLTANSPLLNRNKKPSENSQPIIVEAPATQEAPANSSELLAQLQKMTDMAVNSSSFTGAPIIESTPTTQSEMKDPLADMKLSPTRSLKELINKGLIEQNCN